jgi:hypothetical protein
VPPYQAAIINGFTPQTLVRLFRGGLATDNAGPPLALSPSAASDALGPADPRSKVSAGRRRIAGSPRGPAVRNAVAAAHALASCARPVRLTRPRPTVLLCKKPRPFSRIEPDSSRSILAARQEDPNHLSRQSWNICKIASKPSHWASGPPCRLSPGRRARGLL